MDIQKISKNGKSELMRLADTKHDGLSVNYKTSYQSRAAVASNGRYIYKHICANPACNAEFQGIKTARFCSNACRQANKRSKSAKA
ncbi:hypothetical protein NP590_05425 [Methylomonas sp. SURF-2]|uniref:Uncharacterized protein n=1 Tax=Methylomonas subterranea TaxID=2952225 RepID=A0ABT1TE22_9GAMM|nr:hypothetical protein [Methylomonas sp. SURF-2]MCQ8103539.1 hypothetical protein [Methylomonas sp. SURF-2]